MPIANSDYVPDPFPGIVLPSGTGAPGIPSPGPRDTDSVPVTITNDRGEAWNRYSTETHGTIQPGQVNDGLTGITRAEVAETGAGRGNVAFAHKRYPWQQDAQ